MFPTAFVPFTSLKVWDSTRHKTHLEGQGDLVSRLITPITHIVTLIIPIISLFTKSPDPPSKSLDPT